MAEVAEQDLCQVCFDAPKSSGSYCDNCMEINVWGDAKATLDMIHKLAQAHSHGEEVSYSDAIVVLIKMARDTRTNSEIATEVYKEAV